MVSICYARVRMYSLLLYCGVYLLYVGPLWVLHVWRNFLSTYLKWKTKSVLIFRGIHYQGQFMYMRYTQGQNEEYLLSRSMY